MGGWVGGCVVYLEGDAFVEHRFLRPKDGAPHHRGKDGPRKVLPCVAHLHETRAIVADNAGVVLDAASSHFLEEGEGGGGLIG